MPFRFHIIINILTILAIFTHARPVILKFTDPTVQFSRTNPVLSSSSLLPPQDKFVYSDGTRARLPNGNITAEYVGLTKGDTLYGIYPDCKEYKGIIDGHSDSLTDDDAHLVVPSSPLNIDPTRTHTLAARNLLHDRSNFTFDTPLDGDGIATGGSGLSMDHVIRAGGLTPTAISIDVFSLPPGGITLTVIQTTTPTPPTLPPPVGSPLGPLSPFVGSDPATIPIPSGSNSPTTDSSTQKTTSFLSPAISLTTATVAATSPTTATSTAIPNSNSNSNSTNPGDNTGTSPAQSQRISSSLIAVISVLSILAGLSLIVGIFLCARARKRRRSLFRLPDLEQDDPRTPLRQVERSRTELPLPPLPPPRPRNPFENVSPATVTLDDLNLDYSTRARPTMNRTT